MKTFWFEEGLASFLESHHSKYLPSANKSRSAENHKTKNKFPIRVLRQGQRWLLTCGVGPFSNRTKVRIFSDPFGDSFVFNNRRNAMKGCLYSAPSECEGYSTLHSLSSLTKTCGQLVPTKCKISTSCRGHQDVKKSDFRTSWRGYQAVEKVDF